jgi:hypothetical protein
MGKRKLSAVVSERPGHRQPRPFITRLSGAIRHTERSAPLSAVLGGGGPYVAFGSRMAPHEEEVESRDRVR